MPTYDYRCETNNQVLEVRHPMDRQVNTWGELCELAGIPGGDTPLDAPVQRLIGGAQVVRRSSLGDQAPPCASGPCGGGGGCGLD